MNQSYAILGLSTLSQRAAVLLHKLGATVLAIDENNELIEEIRDDVTRAVCADVRHRDVLRKLGVLDCDTVLLGLRHHFDITVLTVRFLSQNGVKKIVAQVDSLEEVEAIRAVGATHAVFPERDAADRLVKELALPNLVDKIALSEDVGVIECPCPEMFQGKTIIQLDVRKNYQVLVIGIKTYEDGREQIAIAPPPQTVLEQGQTLLVIGKLGDVARFVETFSQ